MFAQTGLPHAPTFSCVDGRGWPRSLEQPHSCARWLVGSWLGWSVTGSHHLPFSKLAGHLSEFPIRSVETSEAS